MNKETVKVSRAAQNNALIELLTLVDDGGVEFPDAHSRICLKYRLSDKAATRLTEEYDALADQFAGGKKSCSR